MLLTGLPGTGKSTALVQLAAAWAAVPDAPCPVLVPLKRVAAGAAGPAYVTVSSLVAAAAYGAPQSDAEALRAALEERIRQ